MKRPTLCMALAALGLAAPAAAAPALGCLIEPDRVADVGSPVVAVIDSVEVERGQPVHKGQVLVVLRAGVEKAALDAARSRADAVADLQAAATNARFNRDRLVRAEDLFRQNFISQQALDQARTESQVADQKLTQAREQQAISRQEHGVAAAQLQQRTIRSPIDGVVAERFMSAGERADDKPLLRIARIDPLRVQLVVPTTLYGQVRLDGAVSVVPDLPGAVPLTARVTMVDRVVDPASNTFRVQLALPNPDLSLPAGLRCKADFGPLQAATRGAATAAAAPATAPVAPPARPPATAPVAAPVATPAVPYFSPWAGRTNMVVEVPAATAAPVAMQAVPSVSPWAGRTNMVVEAPAPTTAPVAARVVAYVSPWAGRTNMALEAPAATTAPVTAPVAAYVSPWAGRTNMAVEAPAPTAAPVAARVVAYVSPWAGRTNMPAEAPATAAAPLTATVSPWAGRTNMAADPAVRAGAAAPAPAARPAPPETVAQAGETQAPGSR